MVALKVNKTRHKIAIIISVILFLILVGSVSRVLIWEHFYYKNQEGQERFKPELVGDMGDYTGDNIEISEDPIPQYEIDNYFVSADMPRYLSIPKIGVEKARVIVVGRTATNKVDVPRNNFDVGWFNETAKPGTGGTSLIDGHNSISIGVFKDLSKLRQGDYIYIEMGSGEILKYRVVENRDMSLQEANDYMTTMLKSPVPGKESISLITCVGNWNQNRNTRDGRTMLRAVREDY